MVRLSVTDNGGNTTTSDVDIRGRFIDNVDPFTKQDFQVKAQMCMTCHTGML